MLNIILYVLITNLVYITLIEVEFGLVFVRLMLCYITDQEKVGPTLVKRR